MKSVFKGKGEVVQEGICSCYCYCACMCGGGFWESNWEFDATWYGTDVAVFIAFKP
ncbi:MAG: hypothetical protein ACE5KE_05385 [Methanosarcinales archaeon]